LDIGFARQSRGQWATIAVAGAEVKERCLAAIQRYLGIEYLDSQPHLAGEASGGSDQAD
jgi:hypothetical protein